MPVTSDTADADSLSAPLASLHVQSVVNPAEKDVIDITQPPAPLFFKITQPHSNPDETFFEFLETKSTSVQDVPLRVVVRQYVGGTGFKLVSGKSIYMALGKLRYLHHLLEHFEEGRIQPTPVFELYWKQRVLTALSVFGFHLTDIGLPITCSGLKELIETIEKLYQRPIQEAHALIERGRVVFEALGELYQPSQAVQSTNTLTGQTHPVFMVTDTHYEERRSLFGVEKRFHLNLDFIASLGDHFTVLSFTEVLHGWAGVDARPLTELTYTPVPTRDLPHFEARGANYVRFGAGGPRLMGYTPHAFCPHRTESSLGGGGGGGLSRAGGGPLPSGGRVMVDGARAALLGHYATPGILDEPTQVLMQTVGRYRRTLHQAAHTSNASSSALLTPGGIPKSLPTTTEGLPLWETVPPELYPYCWPFLVGFSFTAKQWGHIPVEGLHFLQFNDLALDQLVMPEERKQLIRALVRFGNAGEEGDGDVVAGKRGGSVFLLHGPPGVGKTLTAEAIAETLHRPLYYGR